MTWIYFVSNVKLISCPVAIIQISFTFMKVWRLGYNIASNFPQINNVSFPVFENREKIILVMEYAPGGELYDYLNERKKLNETEAKRLFSQIASAIYYCHKVL